MRRLKTGNCPNCKRVLFRRRSIKLRKIKPTICEYCKFKIENPYEVFHGTPLISIGT